MQPNERKPIATFNKNVIAAVIEENKKMNMPVEFKNIRPDHLQEFENVVNELGYTCTVTDSKTGIGLKDIAIN